MSENILYHYGAVSRLCRHFHLNGLATSNYSKEKFLVHNVSNEHYRNENTLLTTAPGLPGSPDTPCSPCSPFSPGAPVGPLAPGAPGDP